MIPESFRTQDRTQECFFWGAVTVVNFLPGFFLLLRRFRGIFFCFYKCSATKLINSFFSSLEKFLFRLFASILTAPFDKQDWSKRNLCPQFFTASLASYVYSSVEGASSASNAKGVQWRQQYRGISLIQFPETNRQRTSGNIPTKNFRNNLFFCGESWTK